MRMKYKCNKCGKVFTPKGMNPECPECGSRNLDVVHTVMHVPPSNDTPRPE